MPGPTPPLAWLVAAGFCLGLVVGSFLNVVCHRLPRGESIVRPGSRCPECRRPIGPRDNIPLLSYLLLRGRCRHCATRIPLRYPAFELATGLLFAGLVWHHGWSATTPVWLVFCGGLLAAAAIDFEHRIVPDGISLGGLVFGLLAMPGARALEGVPWSSALLESAAGALLGGGLLWIVGFAHARLSVALGRSFEHWPGEGEEIPRPASLDYWTWFPGLGFGDVKLMAAIGAFLGPSRVVEAILASALLGLLLGLGWMLVTRRASAPYGLAPAMALGSLAVVLVPHPPLWSLLA